MESNFKKRKHPRLKKFDYSQNGCYFVTVCVKDKKEILSKVNVGRDALIPPKIQLLPYGKIVDEYINNISKTYADVTVDNYIIMPNHIHILLTISDYESGGMRASRPTSLFTIIRSLKTMVTKRTGQTVWQTSFYDEVIKSDEHYQQCWQYIEYNALKQYK